MLYLATLGIDFAIFFLDQGTNNLILWLFLANRRTRVLLSFNYSIMVVYYTAYSQYAERLQHLGERPRRLVG